VMTWLEHIEQCAEMPPVCSLEFKEYDSQWITFADVFFSQ